MFLITNKTPNIFENVPADQPVQFIGNLLLVSVPKKTISF